MQKLYKDLVKHEVADSVRYRAVHGSYDQEKCRKMQEKRNAEKCRKMQEKCRKYGSGR